MRMRASAIGILVALIAIIALHAQQPPAPGAGGRGQAPGGAAQAGGRGAPTAPPGINWPSPPLPDGPILLETALVRPMKITVTKGLNQPWEGHSIVPRG